MAMSAIDRKRAERARRRAAGERQLWLTPYEQQVIDFIRKSHEEGRICHVFCDLHDDDSEPADFYLTERERQIIIHMRQQESLGYRCCLYSESPESVSDYSDPGDEVDPLPNFNE